MNKTNIMKEERIFNNLATYHNNYSLTHLKTELPEIAKNDPVYFYVISTLEFQHPYLVQKGSAPNLYGGVISICTCKHYMRSFRRIRENNSVWIAGVSGVSLVPSQHKNFLFFLMKIQNRFRSHADAWENSPERVRKAKNARYHRLGDLYQPRTTLLNEFSPSSYYPPIQGHPHLMQDKGENEHPYWYDDVSICYKNPSALLFGDPHQSYVWNQPLLSINQNFTVGRGQKKIEKLDEFLNLLEVQ